MSNIYVLVYLSTTVCAWAFSPALCAQKQSDLPTGTISYRYYIDTAALAAKDKIIEREQPEHHAVMGSQTSLIDAAMLDLRFLLQFDVEHSLFSLEESATPDAPMQRMAYRAATIVALEGKKAFWFDYTAKSRSFFMDWMGSIIEVTQSFEPQQWRLTGERKFSGGRTLMEAIAEVDLPVYKSEGAVTVRAYYDPEIPLPFGPAEFHGLPGLILELYIETEISRGFVAADIEVLAHGRNQPIRRPKSVSTMTESEFNATVESSRGNHD